MINYSMTEFSCLQIQPLPKFDKVELNVQDYW